MALKNERLGSNIKRDDEAMLFLTLEGVCNNRCIGCSVCQPDISGRISQRNVVDELQKAQQQGYTKVHFFGGEITLRKDIFTILEAAKNLFSQVYITTNGRMFSYKFLAQQIGQLRLAKINVSLHGHTQTIHQAWTKTPHSFAQTVQGIKNLLDQQCSVNINHVIWKKNYAYLDELFQFLVTLRVQDCVVLNVNPIGAARQRYRSLYVNLSRMQGINDAVLRWAPLFRSITLEDFPFCVFSPEVHNHKKVIVINTSGELTFSSKGLLGSYGCARAKEMGIDIFSNLKAAGDKERLIQAFAEYTDKQACCRQCRFLGQCEGIFKEYLAARMQQTIQEVRKLRLSYQY